MPVICDSTKDEDIKELFDQIKSEQNGRLDILVNNAYAGVQVCTPATLSVEKSYLNERGQYERGAVIHSPLSDLCKLKT